MKDFTKQYSFLIIVFSFFANTLYGPLLPVIADNNTKVQDRYPIRVTTGIQQVQGWEQGLVRANPNLARWHWDSMYSYKQGLGTVGPDSAKLKNGQKGNKLAVIPSGPTYQHNLSVPEDGRPKHIPFSSKALAEVSARYAQPVKTQHEDKVYGKLANRQTQAAIIPTTTVATYAHPYTRQEKSDTALKYSSDETSVYGQLVNPKPKVHYNQAKTLRKRSKNK